MMKLTTLTHVSRKQVRSECRCKRLLFTSCNGDLTFFNAGRKVMILIPKVFLRLLQSFEAIFRRERQLHLSGSRKRISRQVLFVYRLSAEIFFAYGRRPNVLRFRFKSAEWAGNFVVRSPEVGLSIISFTHLPWGLLVWNFGRQRANRRRLFT